MTALAPYVAGAFMLLIGFIGARLAGTWLVWTHGRQWIRGYCAENAGRKRDDMPPHYGRLARKSWLAGWDCSHEVTPYE